MNELAYREFADWWADELTVNEYGFDRVPMPPEFFTMVAERMVSRHGWPDRESAEAFLEELIHAA